MKILINRFDPKVSGSSTVDPVTSIRLNNKPASASARKPVAPISSNQISNRRKRRNVDIDNNINTNDDINANDVINITRWTSE
jgi:hypothetical protein